MIFQSDVRMNNDMNVENARSSLVAEDCKNLLSMQTTTKRLKEVPNTLISNHTRSELNKTMLSTYNR